MKRISVMVNGLPGKMATNVVKHLLADSRFHLVLSSQTGEDVRRQTAGVGDVGAFLIHPKEMKDELAKIKYVAPGMIIVDYTHPSAVIENAKLYCKNHIPFVMGTTGGDRELLIETVNKSSVHAVIAPNMAKQIVVFQDMMRYAAETYPNAFKGYTLEIVESHQSGKADTSGTAKAMIEYFNELGIPFTKDQIKMVREPEEQINVGIPREALKGHGWHTYVLKSEDGSVLFKFTHNVNGRDVYSRGTLDAIIYLDKKRRSLENSRAYSMMDVAKNN